MAPMGVGKKMFNPLVCVSCTRKTLIRCITSAARLQQQLEIPPESPRYVDYPRPAQLNAPRMKIFKGVLPVPRNIFQHREEKEDDPAKFIKLATKEPASTEIKSGPFADIKAYEQRLAVMRRQNLRDGLVTLQRRKARSEQRQAERSHARQAEREYLLATASLEDERTSISISQSMKQFLDGTLETRGKDRKQTHRRRQTQKSHERKQELHNLYTHARNFITSVSDLDVAVEKAFEGSDRMGRSIWAWEGDPSTTDQMLKRSAGKGGGNSFERARNRLKRVVEELAGGKV